MAPATLRCGFRGTDGLRCGCAAVRYWVGTVLSLSLSQGGRGSRHALVASCDGRFGGGTYLPECLVPWEAFSSIPAASYALSADDALALSVMFS